MALVGVQLMIDALVIYLAGILTGVIIVRYGFGLGVKASNQIRNDLTMNGKMVNTEQEFTREDLEEESENEKI
jgi:hypothetical protein